VANFIDCHDGKGGQQRGTSRKKIGRMENRKVIGFGITTMDS